MHTTYRWLLGVMIGLGVLAAPPTLAGQDTEHIRLFNSHIVVRPDGGLDVTETISVISQGLAIKHGIYRDFPTRYRDRYGNSVQVAYRILGVMRDAQPEGWHTQDLKSGVRVYFGRADTVLNSGEHTYTFTYHTERQIGFFKSYDELYWNVTGSDWDFSIDRAQATVELPNGARILSRAAYTGPQGAKGTDFTTGLDSEGYAVFSTTRPLKPKEGFTIALSWPKGFVRAPTRDEKLRYFISENAASTAGGIGLALLLGYFFIVWAKVGRDPASGVIIPQFEAPQGLSPGALRYILRMGYDQTIFAAALIDMAVKGFITIRKDEGGDYTFTKRKTDEVALSTEERKIAQTLFGAQSMTAVTTHANRVSIQKAMRACKRILIREYERVYFVTNADKLIPGLLISVLVLMAEVALSREKALAGFMTLWLSGWSAGCAVLVYQAYRAWRALANRVEARSLYWGKAVSLSLFALPFLGFELFGIGALIFATSVISVAVILSVILADILFYHLLKAPTIKGRAVMDKIEGLELYLSIAEKDRLQELNPPDKTPETFEKFLPYALALGVEQDWCERFADLLGAPGAAPGYTPAWYEGARLNSFGAHGLASSLGSFAAGLADAASPPGSSSGSGGGGSSGGGGGGGGGGGW
ncbi:MAG: DUF2207 domain-containing protein [Syntrophaceae bacterium]